MKHFIFLLLSICMFVGVEANAQSTVKTINYTTYKNDILPYQEKPMVILFGANYCGNSRKMISVIEELNDELNDYLDFYMVNIEDGISYNWLLDLFNETGTGVQGIPFTAIIDYEGDMIGYYYGPFTKRSFINDFRNSQ
jgi:thiol-disulfide isomerase/thioredoxin